MEISDGSIEKLCGNYAQLDIDILSPDDESTQAYCLPMLRTTGWYVICLLLALEGTIALPQRNKLLLIPEPSHKSEYQRIGLAKLFGIHDKDKFLSWLSASPKQSIAIR